MSGCFLLCAHMWLCAGVCKCPWKPEQSTGSSRARIRGSCELVYMGAENEIQGHVL